MSEYGWCVVALCVLALGAVLKLAGLDLLPLLLLGFAAGLVVR